MGVLGDATLHVNALALPVSRFVLRAALRG